MAPEQGQAQLDSGSTSPSPDERALALTCDLCHQRMQSVADLLLLTSDARPVRTRTLAVFGESITRCRDTVAARARGLGILLRDIANFLKDEFWRPTELRQCVEEMCELAVSLTECSAHAAYLLAVLTEGSTPEVPGTIDRYKVCKAAAEIEHKCGLLRVCKLDKANPSLLADISNAVSEAAAVLSESCLLATDESLDEPPKEQFRLSMKSVSAALNTFVTSINLVRDRPSTLAHRSCQVFGEALATTCNAVAIYATQGSVFTGSPPYLSKEGRDSLTAIFSACMAVVSPCVLVCSVVRNCATSTNSHADAKSIARVQHCQTAVAKGAERLVEALGERQMEINGDNMKAVWHKSIT